MTITKTNVTKESVDFKSKIIDVINKRSISDENVKKLFEIIDDVNFGSVTIVIQNGVVIQIERNEKLRLK